ncbi:hypothetical protein K2X92_04865 [Candidatus Gracilibacteria bacterium]|nr:hypothetical protein [Candidatus Gracilibacteria bacterium]
MSDTREKGILELQELFKCDYAYAEKMCDKMYTLVNLSFSLYKKQLQEKSGK